MNPPNSSRTSAGAPDGVRRLRFDVAARPFLVLFELTRACDLACAHCRADAHAGADPGELSTGEVLGVLDDLASLGAPRPIVVLTGGDPLQREDLDQLVAHGARGGLTIAVSPAGTPRATAERLARLRRAGASTVSLSLDGASAERHDAFRRVPGSFAWTVDACRAARAVGLRLQVNTTVSHETVLELPALSHLVDELGANLWSCFFLVPVGRGRALSPLSAGETEDALRFLASLARHVPLKTTEAPHYRRLVATEPPPGRGPAPGPLAGALEERFEALAARSWTAPRHARRPPLAVGDGQGVVFVSHRGDVSPSGFLPLVVGNVRQQPLTSIYATAPLLSALRDPTRLAGRCGRCTQRDTCGGSRAQAFARTGDVLAEDPSCGFEPAVATAGPSAAMPPATLQPVAPSGRAARER